MRKRLREGEEDDDVGGVRRERALDEMVEQESAAGLHAVLNHHHSAAPFRTGNNVAAGEGFL